MASIPSEEQPGTSGSQEMSKEESDQNPFEMNGRQANCTKLGPIFAVGESTLPPPEAPEKPLTPYMRLYGKVVNEVKAANQALGGQSNSKEIHQIIRKKWEELCDKDKEGFTKETETEMVEYERKLKAYHESPAYQAFITAKSKARQEADEKETANEPGISASSTAPTKKQLKKVRQKKKKADALKKNVEKVQAKAQNTAAPTKNQLKKARQKKKTADALKKKVDKIQAKAQNTSQAGPSPSTD